MTVYKIQYKADGFMLNPTFDTREEAVAFAEQAFKLHTDIHWWEYWQIVEVNL